MTLFDRISSSTNTKLSGQQGFMLSAKERMKDCLLKRISPQEITELYAIDPDLARSQISAHLKQIISSGEGGTANVSQNNQLIRDVVSDLLGFGPIDDLLDDPSVTEVMVNGAYSIFFERGGKLLFWKRQFSDNEAVRNVIERIISPLGRRIDEQNPIVNARLESGHRVHAIIPPLSLDGPILTIRKFRAQVFSLRELSELGMCSESVITLLQWFVALRLNIAITGGTGSGKTTLLNALSLEIDTQERIITIEDSAELKFQTHPHVVRLEARPANIEGEGEITIRDLVISSLRMRPDRIVVGEVRGGESLEMLQAMNTGHDGSLTTVHANAPAEIISRLVTMVGYGADLPSAQVVSQIASGIQIVVHVSRGSDGVRRITSVCQMGQARGEACDVDEIVQFVQTGRDDDGLIVGHEMLVNRSRYLNHLCTSGIATEEEVEQWIHKWS